MCNERTGVKENAKVLAEQPGEWSCHSSGWAQRRLVGSGAGGKRSVQREDSSVSSC